MIARLDRFFTGFAAVFALIGGLGLIFATLVTCVSILLKLANRLTGAVLGQFPDGLTWLGPILGEEELVTYGVGLALFTALPWVMIKNGHIRVDLFKPLMPQRMNQLLFLLGEIALTAMAYLILTRQWFALFRGARRGEVSMGAEFLDGNWGVLAERLRDRQESQILGIPLWPTYIVAEICVLIFFVIACFCVIKSVHCLFSTRPGTT